MAKAFCNFAHRWGPCPSGSQQQFRAFEDLIRGLYGKDLILGFLYAQNTAIRKHPHAGLARGVLQAINDRRRPIGYWEHATVRFSLKLYPVPLKPFDSILCLKAVHWSDEFLPATRVARAEFTWIEASVGHIAPAAAGNPHLGQELRAFLKQDDFLVWRRFSAGDSRKHSRRAAARDDCAFAI
jgi:hypothetical protein